MRNTRRPLITLALALLLGSGAGVLVPYAHTQTLGGSVTFEQLGDIPIDAEALVFDSGGTLIASGSIGDMFRLDAESNTWQLIVENFHPERLLEVGPDTLLGDRTSHLYRSLDGGGSWTEIFDSAEGLYQTPSGLLLSGMGSDPPGIAYSTDRGDTWQEAEFPELEEPPTHFGEDFLALPPGYSHAGRLISAGRIGMAYSDDNGLTWSTSNIWEAFRYWGYSVALTPSGRILAIINDNGNPDGGFQLFKSDDGGETWELLGSFGMGEPGITSLLGNSYGYPLSDGSTLMLTGGGNLFRSTNEGESWDLLGTVPMDIPNEIIRYGSIVGPDERVYVGVLRSGSQEAWAWRTVNSVVVANEQPEVPESESSLHVYPNPSSDTLSIEADPAKETAILYDVRGREVLRAALADGWTTLHTGSLPAGVYVVAVGGDSRRVTIAR